MNAKIKLFETQVENPVIIKPLSKGPYLSLTSALSQPNFKCARFRKIIP